MELEIQEGLFSRKYTGLAAVWKYIVWFRYTIPMTFRLLLYKYNFKKKLPTKYRML